MQNYLILLVTSLDLSTVPPPNPNLPNHHCSFVFHQFRNGKRRKSIPD